MKTYQRFIFEGFNWIPHARKIVLRYSLDREISFEETILFPDEPFREDIADYADQIDQAMIALYMIGGISYYKTCCPTTIYLKDIGLDKSEVAFWHAVYENGLGEFFYKNQIDFRGLIKFHAANAPRKRSMLKRKPYTNPVHRILVPFGGGKDSVVTAELLKKSGANATLFRMNAHEQIDELAEIAGLPLLTVRRTLSPNLMDLNSQGALNGHIPITAYVSVLSVLTSLLYGFDAVAMSNERSASIGNVKLEGLEINHQWSKGIGFERMFRSYMKDLMCVDTEYFSLLRPLSELKIVELFSKYPQYFSAVTSCNGNWKINKPLETQDSKLKTLWCGHCPKCAFVFACMAAFIKKDVLLKMFGKNLFDDELLLPLYKELLGIKDIKPFECVGTPDETKAAFLMIRDLKTFNDTPVMKMFESEVFKTIKKPEKLIEAEMSPIKEHFIPEKFQSLIQ